MRGAGRSIRGVEAMRQGSVSFCQGPSGMEEGGVLGRGCESVEAL